MSEVEEFRELRGIVEKQKVQISSLEVAGKRSGAVTAVIGLVSAIGGMVIALVGGAIVVNDELETWRRIKAIHTGGTELNPVVDHSSLNLPDFGDFALKTEIPVVPNLSGYIKFGDSVTLNSGEGFLFSNNRQGQDEKDLLILDRPSSWKIGR